MRRVCLYVGVPLWGLLLVPALSPMLSAASKTMAEAKVNLPKEAPVKLPPFVVDESLPQHWRYGRIPGVEILSNCSDSLTQQLIDQNDRLNQLLEVFLPGSLQPHFDQPVTYVLYPERGMPSLAKQLNETLLGRTPSAAGDVQFMPNIRCPGADTLVLCFILKDFRMGWHEVSLTPGYLHYLLSARTPSLPQWYIEGMLELYKHAKLSTSFSIGVGETIGRAGPVLSNSQSTLNALRVNPMLWMSTPETMIVTKLSEKKGNPLKPYAKLAKHLAETGQWLSLSELFSPWQTTNADALRLRRMQAALFIRWAFDPDGYALRQSLWNFVRDTSSVPATEAVFQRCFEMDYATADKELLAYLPMAVRHSFTLPQPDFSVPPQAELRSASLGERSRLKGRLERLEVAYVQKMYPQAAEAYRAQAFSTLNKSFNVGDRNPELLAELGLCYCDAGDDETAQPFLEAAVRAKVVRPRAWLELAHIRHCTGERTERVLDLLTEAHRQSPPLPGVYELMVRVMIGRKVDPTPAQYDMLEASTRLFPREVPLLYAVALFDATHQRKAQARALVEQALQVASERSDIARLRQLRMALAAGK